MPQKTVNKAGGKKFLKKWEERQGDTAVKSNNGFCAGNGNKVPQSTEKGTRPLGTKHGWRPGKGVKKPKKESHQFKTRPRAPSTKENNQTTTI